MNEKSVPNSPIFLPLHYCWFCRYFCLLGLFSLSIQIDGKNLKGLIDSNLSQYRYNLSCMFFHLTLVLKQIHACFKATSLNMPQGKWVQHKWICYILGKL